MLIASGTHNPAKVAAVQAAFARMLPDEHVTFQECSVESGVRDQPMSDVETMRGAEHRATAARDQLGADIGVGIEGGLHEINGTWFSGNYVCVATKSDGLFYGISPMVSISEPIIAKVHEGQELSDAIHDVLHISNIGSKQGALGYMTNNVITRSSSIELALSAALGGMLH